MLKHSGDFMQKFYEIYTQWCQDNGETKMLSNNKFGMEIKQFVIKTRPRSENRIPHYKLNRKVIIEKFNKSLGKSTSALIDNGSDELSDNPVFSQPGPEKNTPPALTPL